MSMPEKVKACEVSFNYTSGICFRNITFHDLEKRIFSIGRERTKYQFKSLDSKAIFKGHFDIESLGNKKLYKDELGNKLRHYPPSKEDLERDLSIWNEIKELPKIIDSDLAILINKSLAEC